MQVHSTDSQYFTPYIPISANVGADLPHVGEGIQDATSGDEDTVALLGSEKSLGVAEGLPGEDGKQDDPVSLLPSERSILPALAREGSKTGAAVETSMDTEIEGIGGSEQVETLLDAKARGDKEGAAEQDSNQKLSEEEQKAVERLQKRDREVRAHEQAHVAAGGQHVRGGVQYEYATGPDGRRYAVGGEVSIDTSPVSGDPDATIRKAQAIRRAALAPAEPSGQDRRAAAAAGQMEAKARQEQVKTQMEGEDPESGLDPAAAEELEGLMSAADPDTAPDLDLPEVERPDMGFNAGPQLRHLDPEAAREGGILDGGIEAGRDKAEESEEANALEDRVVGALEGAGTGERIERVEVVRVEGTPRRERSEHISFAPSVSKLDYGKTTAGQLFDVYK